MSKTKQDYLHDLVAIAFRMDDKATTMHEKTKMLQTLASLAKGGLKGIPSFRALEHKVNGVTETDFGDEMRDLQKVVKQLRKYKWL